MPQPTPQEVVNAHKALDELLRLSLSLSITDKQEDDALLCQEIIHHALPPIPHSTMAEVEWDDDKHYLAEAKHVDPQYGLVTLIQETYDGDIRKIRCMINKSGKTFIFSELPKNLTPTGYRYKLARRESKPD